MALISKGIELYHNRTQIMSTTPFNTIEGIEEVEGFGFLIPGLQEIGALKTGEATERDKIEVTTLADDEHKYVAGLKVEPSYDAVTFKFLYDSKIYSALQNLLNMEAMEVANNPGVAVSGTGSIWNVKIPGVGGKSDKFTLKALTGISLDGVGTNSALTMTITLTPVQAITFQ